jgi:2-iminoacetate synthase ThiH
LVVCNLLLVPGFIYSAKLAETLRHRYWQPATFSFQSHAGNNNNKKNVMSKTSEQTTAKYFAYAKPRGKQQSLILSEMLFFFYLLWMDGL